MSPPFSSSTQSALNQQRAKLEPSSTNSLTHARPVNRAPLDPSNHDTHRRSMLDQDLRENNGKEARLREEYLRVQQEQQVQRERERARELLRREELIRRRTDGALREEANGVGQYQLAHRQHRRHSQVTQQQPLQSSRRIKREPSEIGVIPGFARKIKDRFPGRTQLARQFLAMMESDTPAEDFLPAISNMFRTAPELISEYQASMNAFDQSRVDQPHQPHQPHQPQQPQHFQQPHQPEPKPEPEPEPQPQPHQYLSHLPNIPPYLPPSATHPPTPLSGNSDEYNDDDYDNHEAALGRGHDLAHDPMHMRDPQERERQAVQHLLLLPDIDIPPEQRKATPHAMSCTLMDHQKVCLTWLMEQEDDPNKRGGLLADTMGLGKTIQALALILAHKSTDLAHKTTLIVAPLSLLKQWEREIQTKVKPAYKLTTLLYHGTDKRKVSIAKLLTYDVVLTTYGTIAWEYKAIDEGKKNKRPVILSKDALFHRVILDEAHHIKTRTGKSSEGASMIKANYRLCMTGTPFMNKVGEIFPLIRFLRIKPYNEWTQFNWYINKPIEKWGGNAGDTAMRKLQALFRSITLRRTKGSVLDGKPILRLPPLVKEDAMTKFNEDQQAFYTALETKQRLQVNQFLKKGMVMRQYTYILVLLLRLRQACCHPHLIKDFGIPEGIQLSSDEMCKLATKLKKGVVERLKGQDEFECPFCHLMTKNPLLIYPCGHPVCSTCFSAMTEAKNPDAEEEFMCPHNGCRSKVKSDKVICHCFFLEVHMPEKLGADVSDDEDEDDDSDGFESLDDEDDIDRRGNLKGFVVSGSEDEEEEEEEEEDADDSEHSEPDDDSTSKGTRSRQPSASKDEVSKETFKKEESVEKKFVEDSDNDSLASLEEIWRKVGEMKSTRKEEPAQSSKRKITPDSMSDSDIQERKPTRSNGKRKRPSGNKSAGPRKMRKGDGATGKKQKRKKKKFMSLAALKKASSTNAAAKAKYLKKLRKDYVSSAKIDKTMEILGAIREKDPKEKTLIFSLWTSFLDLLEIPVIDQGFQYVRYDGSMHHKSRHEAVKKFMDSPDVQIMLVSLSAGNSGLNLTAATHVIIIEPFWNPFVEEQAIDRAHRIGQKNEVTVHRVLIEGTVEDRIRELQEKKRTLVNAALSEEGAQGVGRLTMTELRGLFGFR